MTACATYITHDLAVVGLRAWAIAGDVLAEPTTSLAALDYPDQLRASTADPGADRGTRRARSLTRFAPRPTDLST